ncbi:hypothetical protein AHAS_Ahas16G0227100 [Arachis hypogaea]
MINIKASNIAGTDVVYNVTRICDDYDTIKKFTHELDEDSGSLVDDSSTNNSFGPIHSLGDDRSISLCQESVNEIITIGSLRSSQKRFSSEIPTSISYKGVKEEEQENYGLEIEYPPFETKSITI